MRGLRVLVMLGFGLGAPGVSGATAQPADCQTQPPAGPSQRLAIDLAGRPGVPAGVTGKTFVEVPMQSARTDCGEPSAPSDVLRGVPGDLLRGTPAAADTGR